MTTEDKRFALRRIYLKDASFESPLAPEIFNERTEPKVDMSIRVGVKTLEGNRHDVTLSCTLTATLDERTLYVCEVQQGGLFVVKGYSETEANDLLNVGAPTMLFPYVRAQVSHLTVMGGFPPVLLASIDFEQMYEKSRNAAAGKA